MSSKERRNVRRKGCSLPVRFHVLKHGHKAQPKEIAGTAEGQTGEASDQTETLEGETMNLSERGIYFKSHDKLSVGQALELYFTVPQELTGRKPEEVCCKARVVHVEVHPDHPGLIRVGAAVERFEALAAGRRAAVARSEAVRAARDWGN